MLEQKKKVIPKFKKKLHGFLSDESGKITKEDVLKMGIVAMGVAGIMGGPLQVDAGHSSSTSHANGGTQGGNYTAISNGGISGGAWYSPDSAYCNISTVINGHFNNANYPATIAGGGIVGVNISSHGSHGSHGQHGSHCSCGRWG